MNFDTQDAIGTKANGDNPRVMPKVRIDGHKATKNDVMVGIGNGQFVCVKDNSYDPDDLKPFRDFVNKGKAKPLPKVLDSGKDS